MSLGPTIQDAQHLHVVPDGTIISWYRIPGDATSEAVAFVRREVEYDEPTPHGGPAVTVWVSPGGWDPHTIEDAGVNFPATVIRWGDVSVEALVGAEVPMLTETLCHGGTWSREKALECAVTLYAGALQGGSGIQLAEVMKDARRFEVWLDRDPEVNEDPLFDRPMPGESSPSDYQRLHALANDIDWASENYQVLRSVSTTSLRHYANRMGEGQG